MEVVLHRSFLGLLFVIGCLQLSYGEEKRGMPSVARGPTTAKKRNFYDFKAKAIDGTDMELDEFRGQVLLVVNVASKCGFTDGHYKGMVRLHKALANTGRFNVLAFPSNQFGNQEPDSNSEISEFVKTNYNVEFPVFSKVNVMEPHANSVFKYLAEMTGKVPNWNFWKYLVDHKGNVVDAWGPWTDIEEVSLAVRASVNKAVQADPNPNKSASGPPQQGHEDYGDGAGDGLTIWSEAMPSANSERHIERAGGNPNNPTEGGYDGPDDIPFRGVEGFRSKDAPQVLKPGIPASRHEDL